MTMAHDCSEELRDVDLKVTPARISLMQLLEAHDKPLDAQYVIKHLVKEGVDRVTVFRILNAFVDKGLLRKLEFKEGKARYELLSKGDHHHFICSRCGDITDIGEDTIMHEYITNMERKYGFIVREHAMEFFGICNICQKKGSN